MIGGMPLSPHEQEQIERANASGRTPVVFVHGLWLLPNSWDRWAQHFEAAGYAPVIPGWPDDPETVEEAKAHPEVFADKSVGDIADHVAEAVSGLNVKPAVVGHSFGGLLTQIVAGRGLSAVSVAISPAPFRGVLPLPISALRVASTAISNPANRHRAVPLTFDQFRYGFGNAVSEDEAKELYEAFSVAGPGLPLFQAASANLNPWTEVKVNSKNPERGPMLIVAADRDHTVPPSIAKASFRKQHRNEAISEYRVFEGRGHSLTIDHGWQDVADVALGFVQRFAPPVPATSAVA
jgi:pimeloyl-ACP methyl ester carboxylesterase